MFRVSRSLFFLALFSATSLSAQAVASSRDVADIPPLRTQVSKDNDEWCGEYFLHRKSSGQPMTGLISFGYRVKGEEVTNHMSLNESVIITKLGPVNNGPTVELVHSGGFQRPLYLIRISRKDLDGSPCLPSPEKNPTLAKMRAS